jgi:hypothetical protein
MKKIGYLAHVLSLRSSDWGSLSGRKWANRIETGELGQGSWASIATLLWADYQHRAVSVTDDRIGYVAKDGPLQPAESAATYHYQVGVYLLGQVYDRFVSPFAHAQVGDSYGAARLFDFPDLTVQDLSSLAPEGFTSLFGLRVEFVDGLARKRANDGYDV